MSLNAPVVYILPEETEQVAKAAFPTGNRYLRLRDALGPLFAHADFQDLFSREGRPAPDPARLALITIMQFVERLSDEQAADAVRGRIDWKYLLALPLTDAGFDSSVLSEFRTRLVAGHAAPLLLATLLTQFREAGLLRARGRQRSDSTPVLAAIHALNRLEWVGATLRHALNSLAVVAPEWLLDCRLPEWLERYGPRIEDDRLPESKEDRVAYTTLIGADGLRLLRALDNAASPPGYGPSRPGTRCAGSGSRTTPGPRTRPDAGAPVRRSRQRANSLAPRLMGTRGTARNAGPPGSAIRSI